MSKSIYSELKEHFLTAGGRDPRTRDLPISNSYLMVTLIIVVYVLLVKKIGPAFMANRKPYDIRRIIAAYNIFQIIYNLYMFVMLTRNYLLHPKYKWSCLLIDEADRSPENAWLVFLGYIYFINKIIDCLDTVFFVLTKKYSHISFLHVYHHGTMVWAGFVYMNVIFASHFAIIQYLNTLVHAVMYFYYLVASLKLNIDLSVWKRRLTQFQIVQFIYNILKMSIAISNNWCGLSMSWLWTAFAENVTMLGLFSNFYYKTYIAKRPNAAKRSSKTK